MPENFDALRRRLTELAERSYSTFSYTSSEFLTAAEQDQLIGWINTMPHIPYSLEGGHPACERRIAFFGSEEHCGYAQEPGIACVLIAPKSDRFSDELTHRDWLGALMNLGIRREVLGDIFAVGHRGYLFCLDSIANYIADNLDRVKHTSVVCTVLDAVPDELAVRTETVSVNVASERADAVIGAVFDLSRTESSRLFEAEKVFIDSRTVTDSSKTLREGQSVSVRGFGRFIYRGQSRETRKGRLFVDIEKFV